MSYGLWAKSSLRIWKNGKWKSHLVSGSFSLCNCTISQDKIQLFLNYLYLCTLKWSISQKHLLPALPFSDCLLQTFLCRWVNWSSEGVDTIQGQDFKQGVFLCLFSHQLCPISGPMDQNPSGSSAMGFAGKNPGVASYFPPGVLPNPRIEPSTPTVAGKFFITKPLSP